MGPETEEKNMESSTYKANENITKELEDELMKYTINYDDSEVDADTEVNIMECTNFGGNNLVESECNDETERSSSFEGTDSEVEDLSTLYESEVMSNFRGDFESAPDFDGLGEMFRTRKKKVTSHWRSFIQPIAWRCKWVELQIKKLQSQAEKYDKELEEYNKLKQARLENHKSKDLGVKSLPFSCTYSTSNVLRRKRRRKIEETMDVDVYMSQHNLFSYYENRKHFASGVIMDDELKKTATSTQKVDINDEFGANDEPLCLDSGCDDNSLEQILRKIYLLESQVEKMKSRAHEIVSENDGKLNNFSLTIPRHALFGSPQNQNIDSPPNNGHNMGDVTSHGDEEENDVLIYNQSVKEERDNLDELKVQQVQNPLVVREDGSGFSTSRALVEPDAPGDDQPPPKIRFISKITSTKSKRKRGGSQKSGGR